MRPRSRILLLALMVAVAGCLEDAAPTKNLVDPVGRRLTCPDPCEVDLDSSPGSGGEPAAAIDPRNPDHVVVASFSYHGASTPGLVFWAYAHVTFDGGATWQSVRIPGGLESGPAHPLGTYTHIGDADVHILPDGTVLVAAIAARGYMDRLPGPCPVPDLCVIGELQDLTLFVAVSRDGGRTYPDIRILDRSLGAAYAAGTGAQNHIPFFAQGPDGTLLLAWIRVEFPSTSSPASVATADVMFSTSRDGLTWTPPRRAAVGFFFGPTPHITADGTYMIAHKRVPDDWTYGSRAPGDVYLTTSHDRGATWKTQRAVAGSGIEPPGLTAIPRVDGSQRLLLTTAVVDSGNRTRPVLYTSDDGGVTWSDALPLDEAQAWARTMPAIAVDAVGTPFVAYYHATRPGGDYELRVVAIPDGVPTTPLVANRTAVRPSVAQRDYLGLDALPSGAFTAWVGGEWPDTDIRGATVRLARPA